MKQSLLRSPRIHLFLVLLLAAVPTTAQETTGILAGVAYDATNGKPIPQVRVEATGEATFLAITNSDGRFQIKVPPGTYKVEFSSPQHLPSTLEAIPVEAGHVADASTVLAASDAVTRVDVVAEEVTQATAETLLVKRKLADTVGDAISGLEMRQSTASDAASALEKVTGISVVDDRYVYVRGLGERYSAATLNNALLATTEPERRVVPLDMFPAALIDSINVRKSYSPDLPGEFAGGLVEIQTMEFPPRPTLEVSYKVGFNTRTSFRDFLSYPGGGRDFFGFDDGARGLPDIIPGDRPLDRFNFSPDELQQFGRSLSNNWEPVTGSARPTQTYSVVGGRSFGKLGLVGAWTLTNGLQTLNEVRNFYRGNPQGGTPLPFNTYDYDSSTVGVRMGGLLNLAYEISPSHKISFKNFLSRDTDNEARVFTGFNSDFEREIRNTRLRWVERQLFSTQLEGEHLVSGLGNSILFWQLSFSDADRYEPDLRENLFQRIPGDARYRFRNESQSAFRMFNDLTDRVYNPSIAWMVPFYKGGITGSVKVGTSASFRERDFFSRRLRLNQRGFSGLDPFEPPNELFRKENIRPDGFEIVEETRVTDRYRGDRDVYAGFAMVDLAFSGRWRVVAGVRVEDTDQQIVTFNPFDPERNRQESSFKTTDPLPAVNVIYSLAPRSNLRFGFSETVSRPDFRELALFDFLDVTGGRLVVGNPDLVDSNIRNFDVRWEMFPGGNQLLAASFFYKTFRDPIERIIQPTIGLRTSFDNADSARNFGFELEFRRNLAFVNPRLRDFAIGANLTLIDSEVDLTSVQKSVLTSLKRPMAGQSRYLYNIVGEWARPSWRSATRVYLTSFSERISDVGAQGLPDILQEGTTNLDVVYEYHIKEGGRWTIRFAAENLTNTEFLWTQGGEVFRGYNRGRTFSIGTSFRIY